MNTPETPQGEEPLVITDIKVSGEWLEIYLKDKFDGRPVFIEATVLTDKIRPKVWPSRQSLLNTSETPQGVETTWVKGFDPYA